MGESEIAMEAGPLEQPERKMTAINVQLHAVRIRHRALPLKERPMQTQRKETVPEIGLQVPFRMEGINSGGQRVSVYFQ